MLPKLQRTNLSAVDPYGSSTTSLVFWDARRARLLARLAQEWPEGERRAGESGSGSLGSRVIPHIVGPDAELYVLVDCLSADGQGLDDGSAAIRRRCVAHPRPGEVRATFGSVDVFCIGRSFVQSECRSRKSHRRPFGHWQRSGQ